MPTRRTTVSDAVTLPRILVVDDEPNMGRTLRIALTEDDRYEVVTAASGRAGMDLVSPEIDLVITDLAMPDVGGFEVLRHAKTVSPQTQVIMMTAFSTVQSAVEAMKAGAFEYLVKPFSNDELLAVVDRALRLTSLERENRELRAQLRDGAGLGRLIGRSPAMLPLYHLIERAAESDATILVMGESGTGKELIAREIHEHSARSGGPFVPINCAALTETLLEAELFGHERGAFTGAIRTRPGMMEQAHKGTLFLDEVGEMSQGLQTKLLRVLETKSFQRVGGTETHHVDVRFVSATNRDLERAVADGLFREDLFYRLNVIALHAPPLRDRRQDIPLLVEHLLQRKAPPNTRPKRLSEAARAWLLTYDFPGNVRELENLLERAVVLSDSEEIQPEDLPLAPQRAARPRIRVDELLPPIENGWAELQALVKEMERQFLERAMDSLGERPNEEIARMLGTSRRVLELRLAEFGTQKRRK